MFTVTNLILVLVALAGLLFIVGIVVAGYCSLRNKPENMPEFLAQATTVIGGTLSTNLGAVLGLSVAQSTNPSPALAEVMAAPANTLQVGAAWLYVGGLIIALVLWGVNRFSNQPQKVVSTLPDLTKTLLGVVVGAMAVALGVSQS